MCEFYKLLFDLSVYYVLSGHYCVILFGTAPSFRGLAALLAMILADCLLRPRRSGSSALQWWFLLLPLAAVFSKPGLWQILQLLPAWAYLGYSMVSGNVETTCPAFQEHFRFGLKQLLWLLPSVFLLRRLPEAVTVIAPYLVLMLTSAVCLLRMLREEQPNGLLHSLLAGALVLLGVALTIGRVPQLLLRGAGFLYQTVIARLLLIFAVFLAGIFYLLSALLKSLFSLVQGNPAPVDIQLGSAAELLGVAEEFEAYTTDLRWLRTLLLIAAALAVIWVFFRIFRRLIGERKQETPPLPYRQTSEKVPPSGRKSRSRLPFRPRDPRLAVRWYFSKFLAEAKARGWSAPGNMTATELSRYCADAFPDEDPSELARIYAPARYSLRQAVDPADADLAAALWKKLKKTKAPK